jgi:8-oxo-dGTP diphosphatase
MSIPVKRKVLAYITNSDRLLVFHQPEHPDAGIQVPGGTMRDDESPQESVLREALEETGLSGLVLVRFLGDVVHDYTAIGKNEIHHRHYFHLRIEGDVADTWQHVERDPSEGMYSQILFVFRWAQLPDGVPTLISRMDEMLPKLLRSMADSVTG